MANAGGGPIGVCHPTRAAALGPVFPDFQMQRPPPAGTSTVDTGWADELVAAAFGPRIAARNHGMNMAIVVDADMAFGNDPGVYIGIS